MSLGPVKIFFVDLLFLIGYNIILLPCIGDVLNSNAVCNVENWTYCLSVFKNRVLHYHRIQPLHKGQVHT